LRPGGQPQSSYSSGLIFNPETVLELAASFGISAIAPAKRFGVRVVGVERNPDSVVVLANIQAAGLVGPSRGAAGDIFNLETI